MTISKPNEALTTQPDPDRLDRPRIDLMAQALQSKAVQLAGQEVAAAWAAAHGAETRAAEAAAEASTLTTAAKKAEAIWDLMRTSFETESTTPKPLTQDELDLLLIATYGDALANKLAFTLRQRLRNLGADQGRGLNLLNAYKESAG